MFSIEFKPLWRPNGKVHRVGSSYGMTPSGGHCGVLFTKDFQEVDLADIPEYGLCKICFPKK